ncbi:MAG TPA: hypothetical protein DIU37_06890 [Opitutae bacterium]|nr:hypothetical protein [Opitutae bacterium]|tara:strand:- start:7305 stop:7754 length:450 start_codon:yes stop_codon:yes gene_type:complete
MEDDVLELTILGLVPTSDGVAMFLRGEKKTFVIYIDPAMGNVISMAINKVKKERPLTHDLIKNILTGFGASIDRVVINHASNGTFFARLILSMHNEVSTKVLEVDARPSDCIALAIQAERPIYGARAVVDSVEDVSEVWERIAKDQQET